MLPNYAAVTQRQQNNRAAREVVALSQQTRKAKVMEQALQRGSYVRNVQGNRYKRVSDGLNRAFNIEAEKTQALGSEIVALRMELRTKLQQLKRKQAQHTQMLRKLAMLKGAERKADLRVQALEAQEQKMAAASEYLGSMTENVQHNIARRTRQFSQPMTVVRMGRLERQAAQQRRR